MSLMADLLGLEALARRVVERDAGALEVLVDALLERGVVAPDDRTSMNVRARRWANGCVLVARRPALFHRACVHARSGERTLLVTTWRADATKLGHLRDSDARVPAALRFSWVDAVERADAALLEDSAIFASPEAAQLLSARDVRGIGGQPPIVVVG